jgi:hypothetical protein
MGDPKKRGCQPATADGNTGGGNANVGQNPPAVNTEGSAATTGAPSGKGNVNPATDNAQACPEDTDPRKPGCQPPKAGSQKTGAATQGVDQGQTGSIGQQSQNGGQNANGGQGGGNDNGQNVAQAGKGPKGKCPVDADPQKKGCQPPKLQ